jgi:glycosyltransferase involved in cell wall biosynthesis
MFGWEYPPLHSGGLGVACQGLVKGLHQNGVQVTLVLPKGELAMHTENDADIRTIPESAACTIEIASALQPYQGFAEYAANTNSLPQERSELYGPNLGEAVERYTACSIALTRDVRADVVHSHDWMTFGAGKRAAQHHRIPFIAHVHATELDRTDFHPNPWIFERERMGLQSADRVIAVSNYTKQLLIEHYGIPAAKIVVVHNGHLSIHDSKPAQIASGSAPKTPLVLFLGRLTIQKNPWQFLEVAHRIHRHMPDVLFVMAGDGPLLCELIARAAELRLGDCMLFTGKVDRREVTALYQRASCFVMPSLSEPFGLVALEAIASGVPVVLSKQSGASEVIDHAFKVDFWDTEKMADCILTILRERPLAMQLRSEAPRVLQRLTWAHQAHIVSELYSTLAHHGT